MPIPIIKYDPNDGAYEDRTPARWDSKEMAKKMAKRERKVEAYIDAGYKPLLLDGRELQRDSELPEGAVRVGAFDTLLIDEQGRIEAASSDELATSYVGKNIYALLQEASDEGEGHWVTINGAHVFINGEGDITKGPSTLVGRKASDVRRERYKAENFKKGEETLNRYIKPEHAGERITDASQWEADRVADVHRPMMDQYLAHVEPPVGRKPMIVMLGGGSASGKSTVRDEQLGTDRGKSAALIDPDNFKKVPEFEGLAKMYGGQEAARMVHEESSYLAKAALAEAAGKGLDIVFDTTFSKPDQAEKYIEQFQALGYDIRIMFVDVPTDVAISRAKAREEHMKARGEIPRGVPEEHLRAAHRGSAQTFQRLTSKKWPAVKMIQMFSTVNGTKLVYDRLTPDAEGTIHDPEYWEGYKKKAE